MNKRISLLCVLLISSFTVLFGVGQTEANSTDVPQKEVGAINVFLAASTTDVLDELSAIFTQKTGVEVKTNPASSGTLAHQLEQGAEADVYISASRKWMDYTEELGIVEERSPFVRNRLVLIAPDDSPLNMVELSAETDFPGLFEGRLSMGDPEHVPAGKYAQGSLEYYGWYALIEDRIQPAVDVRSALAVVELGETELGIVYETDALKSESVKVVSKFPEESHTPIEYFCALLQGSSPEGKAFYDFLLGDEAKAVFIKYGFTPAE